MIKGSLFLVFLIIIITNSKSNNYTLKSITDSLYVELGKAETDISKVAILNNLTIYLRRSYPDSALFYAKQAETIALQLDNKNELAECYKNIGNIYNGKDNFQLSKEYYQKSLTIYQNLNDTLGIAKIYNNMGALNRNQSNYIQALEYYQRSLEFRQQIGDYSGMAKTYNNIGIVHNYQNNEDIALKYFQKSLKIRKEYNDKLGMSGCFNNIGAIYMDKGVYELALEYFQKSLLIYEGFQDKLGASICFTNIGIIYSKLGNHSLAIDYLNKSMLLKEELGRRKELSSSLNKIASVYNKLENYNLAINYSQKSLSIANEFSAIFEREAAYEQLSISYEGLSDNTKALFYHKLLLATKDSIYSVKKMKELESIEAKYQFEKNNLEINNLEKENQIKTGKMEKMRSRQIFSYFIIFISAFVIISLIIIRRKLQLKNNTIYEQNEEILTQKDELEKHRNHLEKLVIERTSDLEIAKERAEESDRLKSSFLANLSHEIRTPLNAIVGFSTLITESDISIEQKTKFSKIIQSNSNHLLKIITDIIDIAKIESETLTVINHRVDINRITNEIYNSFKQIVSFDSKKQINIIYKQVNDGPLLTNTDESRLIQILENLMSNAIKFTETGEVRIGYTIKNAFIQFYISDTGIGIAHNELNNIFERFRKIDTSSNKLYGGAGLGLAISKHLVELLGGKIWVDSKQNEGSNFNFTIPLRSL